MTNIVINKSNNESDPIDIFDLDDPGLYLVRPEDHTKEILGVLCFDNNDNKIFVQLSNGEAMFEEVDTYIVEFAKKVTCMSVTINGLEE